MPSGQQRGLPSHRRLSLALSVLAAGMPAVRAQPSAAQCEVAIITASDAAAGDYFGDSVSASGNAVVVGAPRNDDAGSASGSAYVFRSDGVDWVQEVKLTAGDAATWDQFGASVGISGDYIVVGAHSDSNACSGGSGYCNSSSPYVFWYDGTSWVEQAKLTASDAAKGDAFGVSVAISGSIVVVGAPRDECSQGPIDCTSQPPFKCGVAYVFRRDGASWSQEAKLTASNRWAGASFGGSVAVNGDAIVVGAPWEDCEDGSQRCGAAYVYQFDGSSWVSKATLREADAERWHQFGFSVSLSGSVAAVGAIYSGCPNNGWSGCGAAYVFRGNGSTWVEERTLAAPDDAQGNYFGMSVSVSGDLALVGTTLADCENSSTQCRSAYVYRFDGGVWNVAGKLTASDEKESLTPQFGEALSTTGDYAVIGSRLRDSGAGETGAAYIYRLTGGTDCNFNGINDACEPDCNTNGVEDSCDISDEVSDDCTGNGIPDECEPDCNGNGIADTCDIADITSSDCNVNQIPDECEEPDCNNNDVPDECDLAGPTSEDCNENAIPDECEEPDCNANAVPDECEIADGRSSDCDANNIPDECESPYCPSNCQSPPNALGYMSDLSVPPKGIVAADDFIPNGDTVNEITVWGADLDPRAGNADPEHSCQDPVQDNFRVRVYADSEGLPGALLGQAFAAGPNVTREVEVGTLFEQWTDIPVQRYFLTLKPPIAPLTAGQRYWLEVANNTVEPQGNTCRWHWMQHVPTERDAYCVSGTDDRADEGPGSGYIAGSERASDMAFCLQGPLGPLAFDAGPEQAGACCECLESGGSCNMATLGGCTDGQAGRWNGGDPQCQDTCSATPGDCCETEAIPITDGLYAFDTGCTSTDGPDSYDWGSEWVGKDIWYEYTATCTGRLVVNVCAGSSYFGGYDGVVAIHHDDDHPTECPCPGVSSWAPYSDEGCNGIPDGGHGFIDYEMVLPGECWLIRIGGWGGKPTTAASGRGLLDVACEPAPCVSSSPPLPETLRGGQVAATPLWDRLSSRSNDSPRSGDSPSLNVKNRYLSVTAGDPGLSQLIRVRFASLPPPFNLWNGMEFFVGEPLQVCENSAQGRDVPIGDCAPVAGLERNWFWAAPLECSNEDAHSMDWHGQCIDGTCVGGLKRALDGVSPAGCSVDGDCVEYVHLYHEGLVPSWMAVPTGPIDVPAEYEIQVVDGACADWDVFYSDPLVMIQSGWGDVCGPGPGGACSGASDGVVDMQNDVLGVLDKFANVNDLQKARADLEPGDDALTGGTNNGPDFLINVANDVLYALEAFTGSPYPFPPGNPCAPD